VAGGIPYMRGRDIGAVELTPCTEAADGVFTQVTANKKNFRGVFEGLEFSNDTETERIEGTTSTRQNHVIISDGLSISISEIMYRGANPSLLFDMVYTHDVFFMTAVLSGKKIEGYFRRGPSGMSGTGKGKKLASLNLLPIDAGADSWTWTAVT
jgi:hypothetical protein